MFPLAAKKGPESTFLFQCNLFFRRITFISFSDRKTPVMSPLNPKKILYPACPFCFEEDKEVYALLIHQRFINISSLQ